MTSRRKPRSRRTLLGRIHERARLEASRDVDALYAFVDPERRARLEVERDEEPERTLAKIRTRVAHVRSAEVLEVEILDVRKASHRHGGRAAALVRSVVRYDDAPAARESRSIWVRDEGTWYWTDRDAGSWDVG
jgi:hypothetical protein